MKPLLFLITLAVLINASFYNEDRFPTDVSVRRLSTVSSSFTDITGYNTWDHARIPLGIFESQKSVISLNLGYRRLRWKNKSNFDSTHIFNGIIAPTIRVGVPGKVYCDLYYNINPVSITDSITDDPRIVDMPVSRFGLNLISQIADGRFQVGICGQGYYGKEKWNENANERLLMGGEEVGLFLGVKLHEAVLLNIYGSAAGYIDTLFIADPNYTFQNEQFPQERFAWMQLPRINVALDIGMDDLPYMSNMSFTYAHSNFVLTQKPFLINIDDPSHPVTDISAGNDADPIVCDSIAWHMQHLWKININDVLRFDPAAQLGYWHSRYKHMEPNSDNYPINYDGEKPGYEWDTKSFRFGIGGSCLMKEITKIWLEYSFASLNLEVTGDKLSTYKDSVPPGRGYSRIGVGFTTNFDNIPQLGMTDAYGLYLTLGFLFMQENELSSPFRSKPFQRMYKMYTDNPNPPYFSEKDLNVERNRYRPWEIIKNRLNTMNISIGLGATFLDNAFETALHLGFLNRRYTAGRSEKYKGFEFGFDLIYKNFGAKRSPTVKNLTK